MLNNSDSNKHSDFYKASKISFSLEKLLDDFSLWFPKARNYGYTADELYRVEDNAIVAFIPIPIVEDGNYKLWLFCFVRVERMTPRIKNLLLSELSEIFDLSKIANLIHFEHYFIVADVVRGRITPKFGKKSVYVIKADYAYKLYEIIAKAIAGFIKSFKKNVKYGDDLLALCDELEAFAERMRKRADELKPETSRSSTSSTSPIRHPSDSNKGKAETRKEAEEYLALFERARVIK